MNFQMLLEDLRAMFHTLSACNVNVMKIMHSMFLPHVSPKYVFCRLSLPFQVEMRDSPFKVGFMAKESSTLALEILQGESTKKSRDTPEGVLRMNSTGGNVDCAELANLGDEGEGFGVRFRSLPTKKTVTLKKPTMDELAEQKFSENPSWSQRNNDGMMLTKPGKSAKEHICLVKREFFGDNSWSVCPPEIVCHTRCGHYYDYLEFKVCYFRMIHALGQPLHVLGFRPRLGQPADCLVESDNGPANMVPGDPTKEETAVFKTPNQPKKNDKNKKSDLCLKTGTAKSKLSKQDKTTTTNKKSDYASTETVTDPNGVEVVQEAALADIVFLEDVGPVCDGTLDVFEGVQQEGVQGGNETAGTEEASSTTATRTSTSDSYGTTSGVQSARPRSSSVPSSGHQRSSTVTAAQRSSTVTAAQSDPCLVLQGEACGEVSPHEAPTVILTDQGSSSTSMSSLSEFVPSSPPSLQTPESIDLGLFSSASSDEDEPFSRHDLSKRFDNLLAIIRDTKGMKKKGKRSCCDRHDEGNRPDKDDKEPPNKSSKV